MNRYIFRSHIRIPLDFDYEIPFVWFGLVSYFVTPPDVLLPAPCSQLLNDFMSSVLLHRPKEAGTSSVERNLDPFWVQWEGNLTRMHLK